MRTLPICTLVATLVKMRALVRLAACAAPASASGKMLAAPPASPPLHRDGSNASRSGSAPLVLRKQRGRALTVIVDNAIDLETEIAGTATEVRLTAGTYDVTSTLTISRDVTITADVEGAEAVLDGQGTTRVVYIASGTVQLVGLDITNGDASSVRPRARPAPFHGPHGRGVPELTPCPCVRCLVSSLAATGGTLPTVTPHSMAPMEDLSRN